MDQGSCGGGGEEAGGRASRHRGRVPLGEGGGHIVLMDYFASLTNFPYNLIYLL